MTEDQEVYALHVGGPFSTTRSQWPEGAHLWLDEADGPRLAVFLNNPHPQEVADISSGKARFAWTEHDGNGWLLFKYGICPWQAAPFNPQLLSEPFDMQPYERGTHRRVFSFLVHADTGTIAAMRMFTWPAYFLNHVIAGVRRLDALPGWSNQRAARAQQDFYRTYPDGPALHRLVRTLDMEAICLGGQREDRPH